MSAGGFQLAVHDDLIEVVLSGQFGPGGVQPARHHFRGFGAAPGQPALQRLPAGWGQKDGDDLGHRLFDGLRARQVNFDQDRPAGIGRLADGRRGRPGSVQAAVDLRPLQQRTVIDQLLEPLGGHERIVDAIHLTGAGRPGGDGHRKVQVGNAFTQAADDCGFPDGRRAGQHHDRGLDR